MSPKNSRLRCRAVVITPLITILVWGCGDRTDEYVDEGNICLTQDLESDVLTAKVIIDVCYSSGCSELLVSACAFNADGSTLTITNQTHVRAGGGACGDDCRKFHSECALTAPPPGEYSLRHGTFEGKLTLPLTSGNWTNAGQPAWPCAASEGTVWP